MIIPENHAHLVTEYRAAGNTEVKTFTMGCFIDPANITGPSGPIDIANRWHDIWKARAQTLCASEYSIGPTTCYLQADGDLQVGVSDRAAYNGTLGVGGCSPAVSWLLRKNTGLAGRKYRGRMFAPQPRDVDVDAGGNVLAAQITNWATAGGLILGDMNNDGVLGWKMPARLLHSQSPATPTNPNPGPPPVPTPIISINCDPVVGTQRRRQR